MELLKDGRHKAEAMLIFFSVRVSTIYSGRTVPLSNLNSKYMKAVLIYSVSICVSRKPGRLRISSSKVKTSLHHRAGKPGEGQSRADQRYSHASISGSLLEFCLKGSLTWDFRLHFFHESVSPWPLSIPLDRFDFFQKIAEMIANECGHRQ